MSTTTPKTITVTLDEPVTVKDETYTSLTFRRRKARDLVMMDKVQGDMTKTLAMLASMAGVSLPVMEELDGDDFEKVIRETLPLMGKSTRRAMEEVRENPEASPE